MNEASNQTRINWDALQRDLRSVGYSNPLLNFESNYFSQIDIEHAHPSGISQLNASGRSVLSNLFRDPLAFSRAFSAAKRIKEHAEHLESQQGIHALAMVSGLINLAHEGFDLTLPILIWPVSLNRKLDDFELHIDGAPEINPGLIGALEDLGVKLDVAVLLGAVSGTSDFLPVPLLNLLNQQVGDKVSLDITRIVSVGNYSASLVRLMNDFEPRETPLLRSLLTSPSQELRSGDLTQTSPQESELVTVLDSDPTQKKIFARALRGESFAVETLPGCGYTQTVVNLLAGLSGAGKSVLVVAPRRQTLNELSDRLASLGLSGLAVRGHSTWLDVISSISRSEKAVSSNLDVARVRYQASLAEVEKYFDLLVREDSKLGVTLTQALEELAKLSILPKAPKTKARIPKDKVVELRDRQEALGALFEAKDVGEFDYDADDSMWFQARFATQADADQILTDVSRLANQTFPNLRSQIDAFVTKVRFKPGQTVEDWGGYLRLFVGIRDTLARFNSDVFARPLDELIIATGPRGGEAKMSGSNRRRLKKVAKEFLRPGMTVSDMHQALIAAQEQKKIWDDCSLAQSQPEVPSGITDAMVSYQALISDLDDIQSHLDDADDSPVLVRMPLEKLAQALNSMAADPRPIQDIEKRSAVRSRLKDLGLRDLARDLARLKPAREQIILELELAWWQSILEYLIARNPQVMAYSREQIDAIEQDFNESEQALILETRTELSWQQSSRWKELLQLHPDEAARLKNLLRSKSATAAELHRVAPNFAQHLLNVVTMSPYEVANQIDTARFDVLLVLDAAGTSVADNLAALKRCNQVVVFGDPAIGAPDGFFAEVPEFFPSKDESERSIFNAVADAFGSVVLRQSWRPNGQALGSFVNREFYQNRINFYPTAAELLGRSSLAVEIIKSGVGASSSRPVESPEAEVERVVELVMSHAANSPEQSLLVATPSKLHATRIRALLSSKRKANSIFDEWFDSHGREKFEISDLETLSHRIADRIIFSVGFSAGEQNLLPGDLGDLSSKFGRRFLANLLVSARSRIDIVSCLRPEQLSGDHLLESQRLLAQVLSGEDFVESFGGEPDPLLDDLALRLKKLGARVVENYGRVLPLVASYANTAVCIYPDWALGGDSLSEKLRLRPALLRAMGWKVIRAHSFEIFADPQALAIRVAEELGMQVTKKPQTLFDEPASDERPEAWSETHESNDARLRSDKPPHWG